MSKAANASCEPNDHGSLPRLPVQGPLGERDDYGSLPKRLFHALNVLITTFKPKLSM